MNVVFALIFSIGVFTCFTVGLGTIIYTSIVFADWLQERKA